MNAVQLVYRLRQELREANGASFSDFDLIDQLNRSFEHVGREAGAVNKSLLIEVVDGVDHYPLSKYASDFLFLRRADWQNKTLWDFNDIQRWDLQTSAFQRTKNSTITRIGIENGSLVLYPPPTVTRYTAATATVVMDSPTVTIVAGDPAANSIKAGHLWGLGATPTKWYAIRSLTSVAPLTITLTEPYREETNAVAGASVCTTGALRLSYCAVPRKMRILADGATPHHYFVQSTATFTNSDTTVTVAAASTFGLQITGNMEIGLGAVSNTSSRPKKWYKVRQRVSGTVLRMWTPWELETTAGGQPYVLTDESPFAPFDNRDECAIYHAAASCFSTLPDSDAKFNTLMRRYMDELGQVKVSVASEMGRRNIPRRRIVAEHHAFFG